MLPPPSNFGAPPMPGMPGMAPPTPLVQPAAPAVDVERILAELLEPAPDFSPVYASWFDPKRVPKPDPKKVAARAKRLVDEASAWRELIVTTHRWLHQDLTGAFAEDLDARVERGGEEFISSALTDMNNLAVTSLAARQVVFECRRPAEHRAHAQAVQDAANWMRDGLAARHADRLNAPIEFDESRLLTNFGMFAARNLFNARDRDLPFDVSLVTPTEVHPETDHYGLSAVYRVYEDTNRNVQTVYGGYAKQAKERLSRGQSLDDEALVEVIEYWDRWWKVVLVGGKPILGPVAHEYGYVPYTIGFAGTGDPMFTHLAGTGTGTYGTVGPRRVDRAKKAVPFVYYRLRGHELYEAVMARLVTGIKREVNPPITRYQDEYAANNEVPDYSQAPGAQNRAALGHERLEPAPTLGPGFSAEVLRNLAVDRATGDLPPSAYGRMDKYTSGAAMGESGDAGEAKLSPLVKARETALASQYSQLMMTWRNWGHLAVWGGERPKPFVVPRSRPRPGESPDVELTREAIDAVGPRLTCHMRQVNPSDWVGLANAGQIMVSNGFATRRKIMELMGERDPDQAFEEWLEEQTTVQMAQHPKFMELFSIPATILEEMQESEGNPRAQQILRERLEAWDRLVAQPAQQQAQQPPPGAPQGPQPGAPTGPGGPPGAPPGSVQLPPSMAGVSLPGLGMGPGSQGGAVGRPPVPALPGVGV